MFTLKKKKNQNGVKCDLAYCDWSESVGARGTYLRFFFNLLRYAQISIPKGGATNRKQAETSR